MTPEDNPMKASTPKPAKGEPKPDFLVAVRQRGAKAAPAPKPEKRDNVFSKSRDTREDRASRQMKTSHSAQTFPHGR